MTRRKLRAIVIGALGLVVSVILLIDYWRARPSASWPMVRGVVIARDLGTVAGFVKRPRLTIRIDPDGPNVHAVLSMNASDGVPGVVNFRYSGDPSKEVFLEEETSSLTGALLFLGLIVTLAVLWPVYERQFRARRVRG